MLYREVYEDLQTDEGRELLRQKALESIQAIMQQEIGKAEVLFGEAKKLQERRKAAPE